MELIPAALETFIGALIWWMFGWLGRQDEEAFEPSKVFRTFLAALVIAFISVYWGIEADTAEQFWFIFAVRGGLVAYLDKAFKVIWKRVIWPLLSGWMGEDDDNGSS